MIAHFRIIFFAFLSLALGIWIAKLCQYQSMWYLYAILIVLGLWLVFFALHFIFKNCRFFYYFFTRKWLLLVITIFLGLGFGLYHLCFSQYKVQFYPDYDTTYSIYGTVDMNYIAKEKGIYFVISDVTVVAENFESVDTHKLDYNVFVYVYYREGETSYSDAELDKILPGNKVMISGKLSTSLIFDKDGINTFAYNNYYQYSTFVTLDNITFIEGNMGFWDSVREHIRNIYKENMDSRYAGLAFSVLVGDRTELDPEIAYNFQISGIMHVVAVSGLNTAFIMLLLMWVMNKFRINRWVKLAIIILVLGFYALLCDMTPSVVRSSMMSVFLISAQLFGKQRDDLTSISLSGIILLLLFPLYVFDLSFLLSYLGVFGIFLLYKPLTKMFTSIKFGRFASPVALTLSATIMTAPMLINAFGYFSIIGLIANLILVPLFGYVFMILFGITLIVLLLPFLAKLLWLIQWGFWIVDKGAWLFACVPNAVALLRPIPEWALVGYYTGAFYCSQHCIAKRRIKVPLAVVSLSVFSVGFVLSLLM